jgi:hypothetical protein
MSIEKALADLTAALERNTAAVLGNKGAASPAPAKSEEAQAPAPTGKRGPGRPKKEEAAASGYEAQHTVDEMRAALNEVKEAHGTDEAKAIIRKVGKAEKIAEITDPKLIDACYKAAKAKMEEGEGDDEGDDDDM